MIYYLRMQAAELCSIVFLLEERKKKDMFEKIRKIFLRANSEGIPMPLLRDNKTGKGSYTLTMFWMSFNLSIILLAGKVTKLVGDVDYNNVLWLLGLTGSFYLGRKIQGGGKKMTIDSKEDENVEPK